MTFNSESTALVPNTHEEQWKTFPGGFSTPVKCQQFPMTVNISASDWQCEYIAAVHVYICDLSPQKCDCSASTYRGPLHKHTPVISWLEIAGLLEHPATMCSYEYYITCCHHDIIVVEVEFCGNQPVDAYGPGDAAAGTSCSRVEATCHGICNLFCFECSEVANLENGEDDG